MRSTPLIAALAASCVASLAAGAYAAEGGGFVAQAGDACGSGYHPDAGGICQPNVAEVNRFCPPGQIYHPAPNSGWYCEIPETATAPSQLQPRPRYAAPARTRVRRVAAHPAAHRATASAQGANQPRSLAAPAALDPGGIRLPDIHGASGGGGGGWSDRRLKRDIVRLGVSPSGLPVYAFQYIWGGPRYIGAMAQDLLRLRPDAVILDDSGYYKVDYSRIDIEMREETLAEAATG